MAIISKEIKIAARVDLSAILLVFLSCEIVIHSVYNYSQVVLMKLVHVTCTRSCDYSEL